MGIKLLERSTRTFELILPGDEAVVSDVASYREYFKTLDESLLTIEGNPWRFLIRPAEPHIIRKAQALSDCSGKALDMENSWFCAELARLVAIGIDFGEDSPPDDWPAKVTARESGEPVLSREVLNRLGESNCLAIAAVAIRLKTEVEELAGK